MEGIVKEVVTEEPSQEIEARLDTPSTSNEYLRLTDFFGLDEKKISDRDKSRLQEIYQWCKSESEAEMFNKLVTKRNELGTPRLGESRLLQIYTWLRLSSDYEKAKDNLVKYETGN